jgi:hypothetical protein
MTLDRGRSWLASRPRVTSVHSWYLTSFVILSFYCLPLAPASLQRLKHYFPCSSASSVLFSLYFFAAKGEFPLAYPRTLSELYFLRFIVYIIYIKCVTPPWFISSFVFTVLFLSSHTFRTVLSFKPGFRISLVCTFLFSKIRSCGSVYSSIGPYLPFLTILYHAGTVFAIGKL